LVYEKHKHPDIEIDEVILMGVCTDICVISNAMLLKAYCPELPITVDASCCAGVTPESHKNALAAMKMCQINIINE
jgi:nicotinamidase-related amidase